jgi:hypothetical protein
MIRSPSHAVLFAALFLAGCGENVPIVSAPPPPIRNDAGLDRVMGHDARALAILLGDPDLDLREPPARKLQYASSICVLDAYLYPSAPGRDPVVTHIDARSPAGDDIDRASCIAALSRRKAAR